MAMAAWLSLYSGLFVNRSDDYAVQLHTGRYRRVGKPLEHSDLADHLLGAKTYGTYVLDLNGCCRFAVFDDDTPHGLQRLSVLQRTFALDGIASYLERSRRGGHLWVFFVTPFPARLVRAFLLPYASGDMEFYPKQDESKGYGSLIRLPLGVHRLTGKRYSFVEMENDGGVLSAYSLKEAFTWLGAIERVVLPTPATFACDNEPGPELCTWNTLGNNAPPPHPSFSSSPLASSSHQFPLTIREWNATQDPFHVMSKYVTLDRNGIGCCPFGWHHKNGCDTHPSFKVYRPGVPGGYCWYCYTWGQGGSVFDFLRYYHDLDARTMWYQLQEAYRQEQRRTL
jgi:hypothetical protein